MELGGRQIAWSRTKNRDEGVVADVQDLSPVESPSRGFLRILSGFLNQWPARLVEELAFWLSSRHMTATFFQIITPSSAIDVRDKA